MTKIKTRLSQTSLSCRIIAVVIIILLPIFLVFLLPSVILNLNSNNSTITKSMINYSGIDVKSMTEDQMKGLIGMKFSENPPKAPDSNVITREMLPNNCRVIPAGSVVTMDFDEERLNVYIDDEERVKKVKKG